MIKLEDLKVGTYLKYDKNSIIEIFIITGYSKNFIENKMIYSTYKYDNKECFKLDINYVLGDSMITLSSLKEVHYYQKLDIFQ